MTYNNALGIIGNLKRVINRESDTNTQMIHHKEEYSVDHVKMEQSHTDSYLNLVEAEQKITDLELRIIALEEANK